jgi:hypothetical protein
VYVLRSTYLFAVKKLNFKANICHIMMKFAMYEFCEDSSCDVGESHWMVGEDDSSFNNNDWVMKKEVLVRWPVQPKDYSKWANKHGKFPLDLGCTTKTYVARVLKFHGKLDL